MNALFETYADDVSVFALTVGLVALHSFLSNPSIINVHDAFESQPLHRNQNSESGIPSKWFLEVCDLDAALIDMWVEDIERVVLYPHVYQSLPQQLNSVPNLWYFSHISTAGYATTASRIT